MFSWQHILLLFIFLAIPITLSILLAKKKVNLKWILYVCLGICFLSEVTRICFFTRETPDGFYMFKNTIPLQLCSVQVIIIAIMALTKNENIKKNLIAFFIPTALMGAVMALIIPSNLIAYGPWHVINFQYFIYHSMLIFLALFLYITNFKKLNIKSYITCLTLMGLFFMGSIFVNAMFQEGGVNFFYTAKPPVNGLPLLNLNHGWYLYIFNIIWIGALLITLTYLPIIIIDIKNRRKNKLEKKELEHNIEIDNSQREDKQEDTNLAKTKREQK